MANRELYKRTFAKDRAQRQFEEMESRQRKRTQQRYQNYQNARDVQDEDGKSVAASNIVVSTNNEDRSKKQTAYLQRFIEWKKAKKENQKNKENVPQKKPFIPAGISARNCLSNPQLAVTNYTNKKRKANELDKNQKHEKPEVTFFLWHAISIHLI